MILSIRRDGCRPLGAWLAGAWLSVGALSLAGCDAEKMENLEVGVSTEAQVREKWGSPDATYAETDGAQVLEFSRQPAGQKNYMIVIGGDGKLKAIRQVLAADNIGKVAPGMMKDEVRRLLGKPGKVAKFDLKPDEETWEWRWLDGSTNKVFAVLFGANGQVVQAGSRADTQTKDPT